MTILASAARVLRAMGEDGGPLTVTDLVTRLGMPRANASRLLRTMREVGLLETVGVSKRHRPGLVILEAARAYLRSSTLLARADAAVAAVVAECGHTGYVSVRDGRWVAAVTDHPGSHALRVASSIGRRLPAAATATGRSLLARLSDAEVVALYADGLEPVSERAPRSVAELLERLAQVRAEGFALSEEEALRGVCGLAASVGDPATGEAVALCIVCPAATTEPAERAAIGRALLAAARAIGRLTGDPLHRAGAA